jgi:hypothetical protein
MTTFIKAILAQLGSITGIKFADLYKAQPEFLSQEISFDLPAIFVELPTIQWLDKPYNIQQSQPTTVRLHIVQNTLADSYNGSSDQDISLEITEMLTRIYVAMHGWQTTLLLPNGDPAPIEFDPLRRIASATDTRHDTVSVDIMDFSTIFTDYAASPDYTRTTVELPLQQLPTITALTGEQ